MSFRACGYAGVGTPSKTEVIAAPHRAPQWQEV